MKSSEPPLHNLVTVGETAGMSTKTSSRREWLHQPFVWPIGQIPPEGKLSPDASEATRRAAEFVGGGRLWYALYWIDYSLDDVEYLGAQRDDRSKYRDVVRKTVESLRKLSIKIEKANPLARGKTISPPYISPLAKNLHNIAADAEVALKNPSPYDDLRPRHRPFMLWADVEDSLHDSGIAPSLSADIILNSSVDWTKPPCPSLVEEYSSASKEQGPQKEGDGSARSKLLGRLRQERKRERDYRSENPLYTPQI